MEDHIRFDRQNLALHLLDQRVLQLRRQCAHRFIKQCLAGLLLCRAQAIGLEPQLQAGLGCDFFMPAAVFRHV